VLGAFSAVKAVSLRMTSAEGAVAWTHQGYKRWNRCMYDLSASFSSSEGFSGNLANVVCSTFHAARPSSALSRHVSSTHPSATKWVRGGARVPVNVLRRRVS
jgi:hypothetical protein